MALLFIPQSSSPLESNLDALQDIARTQGVAAASQILSFIVGLGLPPAIESMLIDGTVATIIDVTNQL